MAIGKSEVYMSENDVTPCKTGTYDGKKDWRRGESNPQRTRVYRPISPGLHNNNDITGQESNAEVTESQGIGTEYTHLYTIF